jgi:hypothetical protein
MIAFGQAGHVGDYTAASLADYAGKYASAAIA